MPSCTSVSTAVASTSRSQDLDIGPASTDREIKRALARHLEVPAEKLRDYVVDRHQTGNMTVRPEAVFG